MPGDGGERTESLFFGDRVDNDNGMLGLQSAATHHSLLTVFQLLADTVIVAVDGCQAFESLPETRRETAVCAHARTDQGVTTGGRR